METYFKIIQSLTLGKLASLQIFQPIIIHFFIQQILMGYRNAPETLMSY